MTKLILTKLCKKKLLKNYHSLKKKELLIKRFTNTIEKTTTITKSFKRE